MTREDIAGILKAQRAYYTSGATLPVENRIVALKKLKQALKDHQTELSEALKKDLGKSEFEGYMCEIGMAHDELRYMLKHVRSFSKEKTVRTPLPQLASHSYRKPSPYGVTLIMSPWNYPLLLTLDPLTDALAAGNTAVVKLSAYSAATSAAVKKMLETIFPPEYVAVIPGGREENNYLLDEKFDYIFFTGSKNVGRTVLEKAAKYLTPVTLELGGKSPCIVHSSADLKLAAKRIVFGKYLNCGQTCVAPDYILCERNVKDEFLSYVKKEIEKQYGAEPLFNPSYGKIISKKHFDRIVSMIHPAKTVFGGKQSMDTLQIEPTVLDNVVWDDIVMQEEIFGPILPILTYESIAEVIQTVNTREKPLALYLFANDKKMIKHVTSSCQFGGGCINDVIIHLATCYMGFGGVGESGMGSYHGKAGFDTFTHYKSIVDKKTWIDLPLRYQPYHNVYRKFLNFFLR